MNIMDRARRSGYAVEEHTYPDGKYLLICVKVGPDSVTESKGKITKIMEGHAWRGANARKSEIEKILHR